MKYAEKPIHIDFQALHEYHCAPISYGLNKTGYKE